MSPRNARTGSTGRTYTYQDAALPSVTTIINRVIAKPGLLPWAAERVATTAFDKRGLLYKMDRDEAIDWLKRAPWRDRDRGADRGSLVHTLCELIERDRPQPEVDDSIKGYVRAFRQWIDDFSPDFLLTEGTVIQPPLRLLALDIEHRGYAGTLDFVARMPSGETMLVDIKTGKDIYAETSLQLTAYRYASLIVNADGTEAPMLDVDRTFALRLAPDDYDFMPVRSDASMRATWDHLLALYEWTLRTDLVGQSVGPKEGQLFP